MASRTRRLERKPGTRSEPDIPQVVSPLSSSRSAQLQEPMSPVSPRRVSPVSDPVQYPITTTEQRTPGVYSQDDHQSPPSSGYL